MNSVMPPLTQTHTNSKHTHTQQVIIKRVAESQGPLMKCYRNTWNKQVQLFQRKL